MNAAAHNSLPLGMGFPLSAAGVGSRSPVAADPSPPAYLLLGASFRYSSTQAGSL
jgi:hypothetical protein